MAVIITGEPLGGQQGEYFNQHEVTKSSLISTYGLIHQFVPQVTSCNAY